MNAPAVSCYHCGAAVPANCTLTSEVNGVAQPMCCYGCKAVTEAIVSGGLDAFYQHRTAWVPTPKEIAPEQQRELSLFDRADIQQDFVRSVATERLECTLIISGITCAACIWLLEHSVDSLPGVHSLLINHSSHRAELAWDPQVIALSSILEKIYQLGYQAHPFHPDVEQALLEKREKQMLIRITLAGFGMMQSMMFALPMYFRWVDSMSDAMTLLFRWFSLILTLPIILYAAAPFTQAAIRDLRTRSLTMDVPVALALWLAFLASVVETLRGGAEVYYESVCMFTFLLLLSRFLEMRVRRRGGMLDALRASSLPAAAVKLVAGEEQVVAARDLQAGDHIRVRSGEMIPADGRIIEGSSSVNEAALTGEYLPIAKFPEDRVLGGTLNVESPLLVEVTAVGQQTQISSILRIVERASRNKPPIARLADRVARYFVAAVLLYASSVALFWWWQKPDDAFRIVLSILVATCPCALSLATPTALTAATGYLRKLGFLIVGPQVLEGLAKTDTLVFDKTGTLTEGRLGIEDIRLTSDYSKEQVLAMAAALEFHSSHPIAQAFQHSNLELPVIEPAQQVQNYSGLGLAGIVSGEPLRIGVAAFINQDLPAERQQQPPDQQHWIALANGQQVLAWFKLNDRIRKEAAPALAQLKRLGLRLVMLSGDHSRVVQDVGQHLGFDEIQGACTPEDKLSHLRRLQSQHTNVVMIGDGVNDVPVMAGAQLSIAMNNASDLTQLKADAILLSGNLTTLVQAIQQARKTRAVIRQNLSWAVMYNLLILPLATIGWIQPWAAAIGMSLSSLIVVINAVRLTRGAANPDPQYLAAAATT